MRPQRIATKRAVLLQAWRVSQRRSDAEDIVHMTSESAAGWLLVTHGNANVALAMCPEDGWWLRTRALLAEVVVQEDGAAAPERSGA